MENHELELRVKKLTEKGYSLFDIINQLRKETQVDKYSLITKGLLSERKIIIGEITIEYSVEEDLARGHEDENYFYLHASIYRKDNLIKSIRNITSGSATIFFWSEAPNFEPDMNQHFEELINGFTSTNKEFNLETFYDYFNQIQIK